MQVQHRLIYCVSREALVCYKFKMMVMVLKKKISKFFVKDLQLVKSKYLMILEKFPASGSEVRHLHQ